MALSYSFLSLRMEENVFWIHPKYLERGIHILVVVASFFVSFSAIEVSLGNEKQIE